MSTVWTLLITDDCQEDREVYREYLSDDPDLSYQFIEAGSAEVGLALCQKQHCDAILLDFHLPDLNGLEFLDELKQQSGLSLPVIMLTGQGDEQVAVQAMKRGVQDYLVKQDLEPDVLQLTVRNVIQQFHLQNQSSQQSRHLTAEVALRLHRSLEVEQILQTAVTGVQQVLECDRVMLYQLIPNRDDELGHALTKRCEAGLRGDAPEPIQKFTSFLTKQDSSSLHVGQAVAIQETGEANVLAFNQEKETYLLTPILLESSSPDLPFPISQVWGLLVACQSSSKRQWQPDEISFLKDFASQLAIALHQSEQLTQTLAALETEKQLNAVVSQLVATVSHEYRAPLAVILAAASTLKLHGASLHELKHQQFLQVIEDKARQMTQLADDLLVLETFESGKVNFTPMPFELLQFISSLIEEQRQTLTDRYELTFKITGNTRGFWGDQQLLRLILVNLLSNAIKYSTDSGAIEVHLVGSDTNITITVKDEGIGIPAEDQPQMFQSFKRGSNVGTIPGTGLGLAIVKACVNLYGGEITLESQEDKGTKLTIRLPKQSAPDLRFS